MATAHLEFNKEEVSDIVIMPGDPLRAKYIAETYLNDVLQINRTRNIFGYTGYYKNKKISVIASGMGIPSMGIYSYELFKFYDVNYIIRIGTCGTYNKNINLYDLILGENSYSESTYAYIQNGYKNNYIESSKNLNKIIEENATKNNINIIKGNVYSTDVFYSENTKSNDIKSKCICEEMESFSLFHNAKILNKNAACILTVSDLIYSKQSITREDREKAVNKMIELALESAINL